MKIIDIDYTSYNENALTQRRFSSDFYRNILKSHIDAGVLKFSIAGYSAKGKEIGSFIAGNGPVKVLIWSQMHGNESVGSSAIADIFNFFSNPITEHEHMRDFLLENLTLCFLPMLNPDGADLFIRRNAQGIDINRDALALQSPEARILDKFLSDFAPYFAFNLHDQELYYTCGDDNKLPVMSFLAPSFDSAGSLSPQRINAMKLIVSAKQMVDKFYPHQTARYYDSYTPSAFGEKFSSAGVAAILVESGSLPGDLNRDMIRKLNFYVLLNYFFNIADKTFFNVEYNSYFDIPLNRKDNAFDLKLTGLTVNFGSSSVTVDVGISRGKHHNEDFTDYQTDYRIENIGDLSNYGARHIFDAQNYHADFEYSRFNVSESADFSIISHSDKVIKIYDLLKE